jgi:hypothetical protein
VIKNDKNIGSRSHRKALNESETKGNHKNENYIFSLRPTKTINKYSYFIRHE